MSKLKSVELRLAFEWTCDKCGRDQFVRAVAVTSGALDQDDMPNDIDFEAVQGEAVGGGLYMAPTRVKCPYCHTEFEVED